ncbi:MAG: S-adenosylmethionine:tRNA ribosyltransferase-isomerase, partial [Planctomycetota bacterium]
MDALSDYDYELPPDLIAQAPAERRDASRLLVLERRTGRIEHRVFGDILGCLRRDDVLVLNETKVFPARLRARRPSGRAVEILLLAPDEGEGSWSALARPARLLRPGAELALGAG